MAPRETENNAYAKFWGDNKEHYGIGIFWSGQLRDASGKKASWDTIRSSSDNV